MAYLESVDNSLRLLALLSDGRSVTVTAVAHELGVAPSTAHRLLSTLMYRQFAVQAPDRTYMAGPAMFRMGGMVGNRASLLRLARPIVREVAHALEESAFLGILVERNLHVLISESATPTRVEKPLLTAHESAGGKALLAGMNSTDLENLYPHTGLPDLNITPTDIHRLKEELESTRRRGYALHRFNENPPTISIAMPVLGADRTALGSLIVAMPMSHYSTGRLAPTLTHMRHGAERITESLRTLRTPEPNPVTIRR
ncbi:IclR family transcriptional regulator [Dermatophilus congolensis]|uniref:Acetate operon repressor n=1 Tax=Dermatophilus congolensis TaxID=1863 RepID=A0A239V8W5_9MICO|nr:IclR family transcriptional regulator C-terminal domain-containing protein [Dermatophilus congolensis]MBO3130390.1 helix-turn-helix domain-containing protein [Dermatophilus congolensis]MBO3130979.1 helix-turn-helix domain-containing protein [Dermatophilus congolensis]MBO3134861.1 helix-turn-helix domain-containing protein [Dermatophilus congolensis]MBO3137098.1 helix-turn-helix domain-containing protein [Dermatophilus congolensis]MBO3139342.1 helix-turn-helix domain-containing protein [Derm